MNHSHFKHLVASLLVVMMFGVGWLQSFASTTNPEAVTNLLNRIGGSGAADRFVTLLDESLNTSDKDVFVITAQDGKPCIKGSSTLAITTGINWYLNHQAHINLSWNHLTTDLVSATLPVPTTEETHTCSVDYRYYLNYCTFSYSMSVWTWDRWQKEIDWMALHGVNMPLQIVGLDVVWKNLLTEDLGYTSAEANNFIAGPCFQAWWGMNNLQGWGGANPDWWYTRQETLAKNILARERELGMTPVLPGYAGMVPSDIASKKGYTANNQGQWCYFTRPYILDPNSDAFTEVSALYYKRLAELMGTSEYYSMDPFHEGANTSGIDVVSAYSKIAAAMTTAKSDAKWVIQYWQWSSDQYNVLSKVDQGKLIVLDLFSDAHTHFGEYNGHDAVYCALPNFGGRTGLFGRLTKIMTDFYTQKSNYSNVKGVGATPEAIEQVPVLYDALFELPWYTSAPDAKSWLADYTTARYGVENSDAQAAWEKIRNSALNCETSLQGPHEAVLCARPALTVNSVSSWGGTDIFYDPQDVVDAAYKLLQQKTALSGDNYSYDLTDFSRQALTDYGKSLLAAINDAVTSGDQTAYAARRDAYLQLILDLDELLNTNVNFMLGRWTQMARGIADEVTGTEDKDKQWLELNNARTLITTWGDYYPSEYGGLRDYSYREWGGMMKDFYYARWKTFFDNRDNGTSQPNWYESDRAWALNAELSYSNEPTGNTADVATSLFSKYFVPVTLSSASTYYLYRYTDTDLTKSMTLSAYRGENFEMPVTLPSGLTATLGVDYNNDGLIADDETTSATTISVPSDAVIGSVNALLNLSDGTTLKFKLALKDNITTARTVSVATADASQGSVEIVDESGTSVTTMDDVTVKATAASGYDFLNWTDASGNVVSTSNPYTYYGAAEATFTANFSVNKWAGLKENLGDLGTISSYGQYVKTIAVSQNGGDENSVYSVDACPSTLFQTTQLVTAAAGSKIIVHATGAGGLNYCNLSAYADWNGDGDFDDENELLLAEGTKSSAGNSALNNKTLEIYIPYDATQGVTHIRFRYDSSWASGYDSSTGAMPAKAETSRMVYDIPVNITDKSAVATTITVSSSDESVGTVDQNGQTNPYTYKSGEQIILRAYPKDGYKVTWKDGYGRNVPESWVEGNFLKFYAPESGSYVGEFEQDIREATIGNWKFRYTYDSEGITLNEVISGEGELTIPEIYDDKTIIAIAPEALLNQTELTKITLSSAIKSVGQRSKVSTSFIGSKVQDASVPLSTTLANDEDWSINFTVSNNSTTSFNQWGSSLLATGTESLGATYNNGFQLYLKANESIILKLGSYEKKTFTVSEGAKSFDVAVNHTASGDLTVTVTCGDNSETYTESNYTLNDITQLCNSLPVGINLTPFVVDSYRNVVNPFEGCSKLEEIAVDENNTCYESDDLALYSKDDKVLLAYPENAPYFLYTIKQGTKGFETKAMGANPNLYAITLNYGHVKANKNAFANNGLHVLLTGTNPVTTDTLTFYREAYNLPLMVCAFTDNSLSNDVASALTSKDALMLFLNNMGQYISCASVAGLSSEVPVVLSYPNSSNSSQLYPFYFPSTLKAIRSQYLPKSDTSLDQFTFYTYTDGAFAQTTSVDEGAYLVEGPADWNKQKLFFLLFDNTASSAAIAEGWTGNGTATAQYFEAPYYTYDASTDVFTLQSSDNVKIFPFQALFIGNESSPKTILGPDASKHGSFTISSVKFATLYLGQAYTMPEGVTGYAVESKGDGYIQLAKAYEAGEVVPSKTPLLLYGEPGTYNYVFTSDVSAYTGDNLLHGTLTDEMTSVDGNNVLYYKLTTYNGAVGFYWGTDDGSAFINKANKAYLALTGDSQSVQMGFSLNDLISGISQAQANEKQPAKVFDLSGRRVSEGNLHSKGFYIVNGKKTVVGK